MQNLTLQQIFGANATQTATTLTITKADLSGLTSAANNRAEQTFVAILLQLHQHFEGLLTDDRGKIVTDEQGQTIAYDNKFLYEKICLYFWKRQFIYQRNLPEILDSFVLELFLKLLFRLEAH